MEPDWAAPPIVLGDTVLLHGESLKVAGVLIAHAVEQRKRLGQPVPKKLLDVRDATAQAYAEQQRRHGDVANATALQDFTHERIGTDEAARILGVTRRHVQRIARSLDGHQDRSGRWHFDRGQVDDYARYRPLTGAA